MATKIPTRRRGKDTIVFLIDSDGTRYEMTGKLRGFDGLLNFGEVDQTISFGGGGGSRGLISSGYKRTNPNWTIDENDFSRKPLHACGGKEFGLEVAKNNSMAAGQPKETVQINVLTYRHTADSAGRRRYAISCGAVTGITKGVY